MTTTKTKTKTSKPPRTPFSDELRGLIERSGRTPYAIAKDAGIDPGILSRFLAGRHGLTTATLDRLAPVLGIHVAVASRPKGRPRRDASPLPSAEPIELDNPPTILADE